ncbi:MAG: amidohydrolase family protein, partial [Acidobacteria bacterium]|nr:amidohydrolase family protein [Acidobacteriota bacterium]
MTTLTGAAIVLPERTLARGALDMADGRITGIREIEPGDHTGNGADVVRLDGLTLIPGFIDVHVHGVAGVDVLDDAEAVARVAQVLPRYGVTAFCPTSVACTPAVLQRFLEAVSASRSAPVAGAARVLPAHLESNFINPAWAGAQPVACLRACSDDDVRADQGDAAFDGEAILRVIEDAADAVAIVTIAPELPGGLALVRRLRDAGLIVSIGHSGATYDQARAAIAAGVTHAT